MYSPNLQTTLTFSWQKDRKINQLEIFGKLMISFDGLNFTLLPCPVPPTPWKQGGDLYIRSWKCSESFDLIGHPIQVKLILNHSCPVCNVSYLQQPIVQQLQYIKALNLHYSWKYTNNSDQPCQQLEIWNIFNPHETSNFPTLSFPFFCHYSIPFFLTHPAQFGFKMGATLVLRVTIFLQIYFIS